MAMPPLPLPPSAPTDACPRCGLHRPASAPACPHCADLSDMELVRLRERLHEEQRSSANLGKLFLYVAALILAGLFVLRN